MKKLKVNENILALILLLSFFASDLALVISLVFIWAFCEINDTLKDLSIKVGVVMGAILILSLGWGVVEAGKDLIFGGLNNIFEMLVSWGVTSELTSNANQYVFSPVNSVFTIADYFIVFVILFVKLRFVLSVVKNEEMGGALWPLQSLINKMMNFVNNNFYEENKAPKKTASGNGFCNKCGAKADGKSPFCSSCGNKL